MDERERITEELIKQLVKMGYPAEFGKMLYNGLGVEDEEEDSLFGN